MPTESSFGQGVVALNPRLQFGIEMRSFENSIGEDDFRALGNKLIEVAIEITLRLGNAFIDRGAEDRDFLGRGAQRSAIGLTRTDLNFGERMSTHFKSEHDLGKPSTSAGIGDPIGNHRRRERQL